MPEIHLWQSVLLIITGIVAGFLNVIAGGGSLLSVPMLIFLGIPGAVANGTNRIAILTQNITAVATYYHKGFSDFKLGLSLAVCAVPGAVLGAWMGTKLHGVWFNRVLALIMIAVMVLMSIKKKDTAPHPDVDRQISPRRMIAGHVMMFAAGLYGGFIQIGIGFILMLILHRVLAIDLVRVNMYKVFIVLCYTIVALGVFMSQLQLVWLAGISLAIGNAIGGWLGVHLSIQRGERLIRYVLYAVLIIMIIKLLY